MAVSFTWYWTAAVGLSLYNLFQSLNQPFLWVALVPFIGEEYYKPNFRCRYAHCYRGSIASRLWKLIEQRHVCRYNKLLVFLPYPYVICYIDSLCIYHICHVNRRSVLLQKQDSRLLPLAASFLNRSRPVYVKPWIVSDLFRKRSGRWPKSSNKF